MAVTDYSTSCGSAPLTFIQMLASLIRGYHDIAGLLHYRLNSLVYADACTELSDFLTCNTSHIEPERQLHLMNVAILHGRYFQTVITTGRIILNVAKFRSRLLKCYHVVL
jgi:hypothetical protein